MKLSLYCKLRKQKKKTIRVVKDGKIEKNYEQESDEFEITLVKELEKKLSNHDDAEHRHRQIILLHVARLIIAIISIIISIILV